MRKILLLLGLLLICCGLPVCAEEWSEPDVSKISLTALSDKNIYIGQQAGQEMTFQIKINSPDYEFNDYYFIDDILSSNENVSIYLKSVIRNVITLSLYSYGDDESTNINVIINGKTFPAIPARIRRLEMNKNSVLLVKGKSEKLKVKSGNKTISSGISWTSSRPKVVSVDKNGKVKGKKKGNSVITAVVNGKKVGCVVSVSGKKKISAVKTAARIVKTGRYSQKKRMKSGYYDCSSLMWKAYHKNGCNFGSSSYAPTAADQAKYLAKKKKLLGKCSQKKINSLYYQVGDVCYHSGSSNGRYKNIYHTEMFIGYVFDGFDAGGKPQVRMGSLRSGIFPGDLMGRP